MAILLTPALGFAQDKPPVSDTTALELVFITSCTVANPNTPKDKVADELKVRGNSLQKYKLADENGVFGMLNSFCVRYYGIVAKQKKDLDKEVLRILEKVAEGQTLNQICTLANAMPTRATFRRWCMLNPDLGKAYREATLISATALEEEAIDIARQIRANSGTGTEVRAAEVAMNQFRWSATRRDPAKYGERQQASIIVPIQINTNLNLGQDGDKPVEESNIYDIKAQVMLPVDEAYDRAEGPPPNTVPEAPGEIVVPEKGANSIKLVPKSQRWDPKAPRKRVLTPRVPKT